MAFILLSATIYFMKRNSPLCKYSSYYFLYQVTLSAVLNVRNFSVPTRCWCSNNWELLDAHTYPMSIHWSEEANFRRKSRWPFRAERCRKFLFLASSFSLRQMSPASCFRIWPPLQRTHTEHVREDFMPQCSTQSANITVIQWISTIYKHIELAVN